MAVLETSASADGVVLTALAPSRAILLAGRPLGETIVQLGPFVMTSEAEVRQALYDFRSGRLTA
jgi:redox-sensitive bicupin YhaK (pirin superfamily)